MKLKHFLPITAVLCLSLLAGCGSQTSEPSVPEDVPPAPGSGITAEYSNLSDASSRELAAGLLTGAGISAARQEAFFSHVDQFNDAVSPESLTEGFECHDISLPKYDPYTMQDEWLAAHPESDGFNCRITAFSLFSDFLTVSASGSAAPDGLEFDLASLDADPSVLAGPEDRSKFTAFYAKVPTVSTKDTAVHVENLQKEWAARGIVFEDRPEVRLISMVFHDDLGESDQLFIGHTGILLPAEDGTLYFLEKLAFQEPYQLVKFSSRAELSTYLTAKYDLDFNQPTASPFILENDQLMTA